MREPQKLPQEVLDRCAEVKKERENKQYQQYEKTLPDGTKLVFNNTMWREVK